MAEAVIGVINTLTDFFTLNKAVLQQTEKSRIFPSWHELDDLRTPLTAGERALTVFLDDHLPSSWLIYVQPYINDMRPDIVVMNPNHGIVVFEVKDWSLGRYSFDGGRMLAHTHSASWFEDDPVEKAKSYARSLYAQFLVSDEAVLDVGTKPNDGNLCQGVTYFHCASTEDARRLYSGRNKYVKIIGSDYLQLNNLEEVIPYYSRSFANFVRPQQKEALIRAHAWLVPPKHAIEQQKPTFLTPGQAQYAKPESGFRRIRGVAGAGKSYVLSHRAAMSNAEGKNVLVLSFNITMSHVLKDLIMRAPSQVNWKKLTWGHFHGWAKNQLVEAGLIVTNSGEEDEEFEGVGNGSKQYANYCEGLEKILSKSDIARSYTHPTYGGIYIDEGQDFDPNWLDTLAGFLEEGGELVVFADHKQNIYQRDGARDINRSMRRCKFSGRWAQLPQKSHRLPWRITMFLNEYSKRVKLGDDEDLEMQDYAERIKQGELELDVLAWKNLASFDECLKFLPNALETLGNPNPGDVVILVPTHELGLIACKQLSSTYHQIVHVFGPDGPGSSESRRRKMAFWMGRGGLKMSTVHSFKGWELDNVILIWPSPQEFPDMGSRSNIFYTALSRAMRNLVVLNSDRSYDQFETSWDTID